MGQSYTAMVWIYGITEEGIFKCGRTLGTNQVLICKLDEPNLGFYAIGTILAYERYCVDLVAVPIPPAFPDWPYGNLIGPPEPV